MLRTVLISVAVLAVMWTGGSAVSGQHESGASGEVCSLPPDDGPCDGKCPRYFFNTNTRQCEGFIWGCCEGNANNFLTLEACETACLANVAGSVPSVSSWGLLALCLLIMIALTTVFRRVKVAA